MKIGEILQAFVISVLLLNKTVNVNEKRFFLESKNVKSRSNVFWWDITMSTDALIKLAKWCGVC